MKEKKRQLIVTFHTTAESVAMERACRAAGIEGRLAPVPRQLTADCGISWRAAPDARGALEQIIRENNLEAAGIYEMEV